MAKLSTYSGFSDVLRRTFIIYGNNFFSLIAIVAFVTIPLTLLSIPFSTSVQTELADFDPVLNPTLPDGLWLFVIISLVTALLQGVIVNGLVTVIASENYLGRKADIPKAFALAKDRLIPLASGIALLIGLFFVATMVIVFTSFLLLFPFLLLPVLLYLGIAISYFVVPILLLENIIPVKGIYRALALGKAYFWPPLMVLVVLTVGSSLVSIVFIALVNLFIGLGTTTDPAYLILTSVISVLTAPLFPISLTVLYYDVRMYKEQLDQKLKDINTSEPRPSDIPSPEPDETQRRLLTPQDLPNIALVTVGGLALMFLYLS